MERDGTQGLRQEEARHILHPVRATDEFFWTDYNMNLYRGCSHGCIYCDSCSVCYQLADFAHVRPKKDAIAILREDLKAKRRPGLAGSGAMSDPYNPLEEKLCITRDALSLLLGYGFGASITTKSALAARDALLLRDIQRHAPTRAIFSITTPDDALSRVIEPNVSVSSERLGAMARIAEAGVFTGVWINPMLPFLTDGEEELVRLLKLCHAAGAQFAMCFFGMTLRTGSREYFYQALDQHFPGLKAKYAHTFGLSYHCESPNAHALWKRYEETCQALGLHYTFPEINAAMRRAAGGEQLSFL